MTWLSSLTSALNQLALALRNGGDLAGALAAARRGLALSARVAEIDSSNAMSTSAAAWAEMEVGDLQAALDDLDGARRSYRSARAVFETLAFAHAFPRRLLGWLGEAEEALGQVELAAGRLPGARAAFARGIAFLATAGAGDPTFAMALARCDGGLARAGADDGVALARRGVALIDGLVARRPPFSAARAAIAGRWVDAGDVLM